MGGRTRSYQLLVRRNGGLDMGGVGLKPGGGGGGLHFRRPPDVFADAAARTAAFSAGGSVEGEHIQFAADRSLAIIIGTLANPAFQTYTGGSGAYDDTLWVSRTDAVQSVTPGPAGPAPSAANVDPIIAAYDGPMPDLDLAVAQLPSEVVLASEFTSAEIISLITGNIAFSDIAGLIADGQAPASFMRDAELTLASVAAALGLTTAEVAQLLVGAPTISGRDLTYTLNDGSTVTRQLPDAGGTADGRLRFGVGDPASTLGIDGDSYVNLSSGDAWEKIAGVWTEHGTFTFARLLQMSRTRYATVINDNTDPLESEWLAGNTSETDHINLPPRSDGQYDGFAIPAWQASLTTMMQAAGVFNERGLFVPGTNDADVTQMISGVSCKTYIRNTSSGARVSVQPWILSPGPP